MKRPKDENQKVPINVIYLYHRASVFPKLWKSHIWATLLLWVPCFTCNWLWFISSQFHIDCHSGESHYSRDDLAYSASDWFTWIFLPNPYQSPLIMPHPHILMLTPKHPRQGGVANQFTVLTWGQVPHTWLGYSESRLLITILLVWSFLGICWKEKHRTTLCL